MGPSSGEAAEGAALVDGLVDGDLLVRFDAELDPLLEAENVHETAAAWQRTLALFAEHLR